ncbi:MAG: molybdopterin cofactor-binding domain-containing protein, partial [Armatimonadota bacterium]
PLYRCKNIIFEGQSVYTNLPVGGAYRGYGATQGYLAMEIQMDEMAEAIGMDPVKLRRLNHIKSGEGSPVFEALGEGKKGVEQKIDSCGLSECLTLGAKEIGWDKRNKLPKKGRYRRGIGMCALMQGSSVPMLDMGACFIKMNDDGSFNLLVGATDLGTGSDTILAQIAAEVLATTEKEMIVYSSDTDITPFDVGAYASSTTYLSGYAVIKAAQNIKEQILKVASEMLEEKIKDLYLENKHVLSKKSKKKVSFSDIAYHSLYISNQHQIMGSSSHITHASPPPFSAHFAEVEVDTLTGKVKLLKYVAATDCGTAINPTLAEGQVEGAVVNGLSFALTERFIFNSKGKLLNANLSDYKIFSTSDMPELKAILVPTYESTGPYGAKSVSEIGINGPMPAISNAIYNACGIRLRHAPFTPDKVLGELKKKK